MANLSAGRCPSVRRRIVSPAGVVALSTRYNHFITSPNCRMARARMRCAGCACGSPTIVSRIIPPASVQDSVIVATAPYDHFSARPNCRITEPTGRRVLHAAGCSSAINAIAYTWCYN
jgi:hypothetical protein